MVGTPRRPSSSCRASASTTTSRSCRTLHRNPASRAHERAASPRARPCYLVARDRVAEVGRMDYRCNPPVGGNADMVTLRSHPQRRARQSWTSRMFPCSPSAKLTS
jgi:hypothetical protein